MVTARPSPGDLLVIDGRASVQFAGERALTFRVVSVSEQPTYDGWIWLTGYVLDRRGEATAKREVYVRLAGLRRAVGRSRRRGSAATTTHRRVRPGQGAGGGFPGSGNSSA
ncbi:hypothetical protein ACIBTZ_23690 [Micromonospora sp. NPDC049460]|uniref:hypothetical protein n=1 Tax=Micromonospora sp. NPDC049460 TaxID=3364272 RepID=UPI0037BDE4E8